MVTKISKRRDVSFLLTLFASYVAFNVIGVFFLVYFSVGCTGRLTACSAVRKMQSHGFLGRGGNGYLAFGHRCDRCHLNCATLCISTFC